LGELGISQIFAFWKRKSHACSLCRALKLGSGELPHCWAKRRCSGTDVLYCLSRPKLIFANATAAAQNAVETARLASG